MANAGFALRARKGLSGWFANRLQFDLFPIRALKLNRFLALSISRVGPKLPTESDRTAGFTKGLMRCSLSSWGFQVGDSRERCFLCLA